MSREEEEGAQAARVPMANLGVYAGLRVSDCTRPLSSETSSPTGVLEIRKKHRRKKTKFLKTEYSALEHLSTAQMFQRQSPSRTVASSNMQISAKRLLLAIFVS